MLCHKMELMRLYSLIFQGLSHQFVDPANEAAECFPPISDLGCGRGTEAKKVDSSVEGYRSGFFVRY